MKALQAQNALLLSNQLAVVNIVRSNAHLVSEDQALGLQQQNEIDSLSNSIYLLESRLPGTARLPQSSATSTTPDGIPKLIYNQIVAAAQRDWPNDYEKQKYRISELVEAYQKAHQ